MRFTCIQSSRFLAVSVSLKILLWDCSSEQMTFTLSASFVALFSLQPLKYLVSPLPRSCQFWSLPQTRKQNEQINFHVIPSTLHSVFVKDAKLKFSLVTMVVNIICTFLTKITNFLWRKHFKNVQRIKVGQVPATTMMTTTSASTTSTTSMTSMTTTATTTTTSATRRTWLKSTTARARVGTKNFCEKSWRGRNIFLEQQDYNPEIMTGSTSVYRTGASRLNFQIIKLGLKWGNFLGRAISAIA